MILTYMFHSGFKLETEDKIIIFDYFKDNCCKSRDKIPGFCYENLGIDKDLYFFVSHAHYDHYDKDIFKFKNTKQYFISEDLKVNKTDRITFCKAYESFQFDDMKIFTFGSTDEGVSFLVEVDGKKIFHAGDLNWWHWDGETKEEQLNAEKMFFYEIDKLRGQEVDIAMFPVDPRLDRGYCLGGKVFIENIKPKLFVPMHFLDCYNVTKDFQLLMSGIDYCKVVTLSKRGEEVEL
ncbi:MAG: MBL fold metallo-hydrolase [Filifactoraceae bacterium]